MSGEKDRDVVGIEMDDLEKEEDPDDTDYQPTEERNAAESPYKKKFKGILTDGYDDQQTWWAAVEDLLKKDGDFREKVAAKTQAEGVESRKQAIVEVMVDLLLDIERITEHQGLVYVLDEELESFPLEFMAIELLKRGADPRKETGYSGSTLLHLAITGEKMDLVKLLLEKGAHLDAKDDYGFTPLLKAVEYGAPEEVIDLLLKHGANVHVSAEDRKTALHFAAQKDDVKTMKQVIKKGLPVDAEDKDGWTPLHEAARYGSKGAAAVLTKKGASVNARNHRKRTPLHVAAEEGEKELIKFLLSKKADAMITDLDGNTPVDLAAKKQHKEIVNILLKYSASSKKDKAVKKDLVKAMGPDTDIKDGLVKEKISEMSPFSVVSMLKAKKCGGEGKFQLITEFAKNSKLKESTKAILDQFVVGKRRGQVFCEIIDADENGIPPDGDDFNESSPSLLDVIVKTNDKELAQHPSIRAMLDYKWEKFAKRLFLFSLMLYAIRMLFFGLALLIAARPDLDNPGCYRDGWDYFRGVCEGISILFFLIKLGDEILEMFWLRKLYHEDKYNYLQLLAAILPLLIIPFRAATTWCASTGDCYGVEPSLLPNAANATNFTLDINQACITASSVQWIIASLAYMANAVLVLEYLALSRQLGVYVTILKGIVVKDILKFTVLFLVVLYIFVGSLYLALRAGIRDVDMSTGAITSDLEVFGLQTLYPWHVVFTGLRILVESGEIFDGKYFANDANGQYVGYQWFSIVMYLAFLFAVIVVLLNLLIAQMSDTYEKIQKDVEGTFAIARARIISRLQKGKHLYWWGKSYRKRHFEKVVWTELPDEELKQDEQDEQAKEKDALMEQKTDWLKETSAELTRRLQDREASAQEIKSRIEHKLDQIAAELTLRQVEREGTALSYKSVMEMKVDTLTDNVSIGLQNREDSAQQIKSLIEEKVDQVAAELTKRQLEREDTALQYKSLMEQKVDQMAAEVTKRQLEREESALQYKSLIEQKVDQMAAELTKRQLEREDTALQYKSLMEQKVDQMAAELTKRQLEREDSAQQIKSLIEEKVDQMAAELTKRQLEREDSAQQIKSLMEQKVDQMAAEVTKRQLEREESALQYKSLIEQKVDQMAAELTKRQLEREDTALQYKSLIEQKVDQMAAELTKRQLEREDTALQYKRLLEQKVDRLTEMTAELTGILQGREGQAPFRGTH